MSIGATARLGRLKPREGSRKPGEGLFVTLAAAHAVALIAIPSIPLIALGLWWNANTIAHNFIHRPFFRTTAANRGFSAFLSLVLGVPQSLWRQRHLRHHAESSGGVVRPIRITRALAVEAALVLAMWGTMAIVVPRFFLLVYLPGWGVGLALCQLQGYFEHAGGTTSYYGRLYNLMFFNDGYHVEHHRRPAMRWNELPSLADTRNHGSQWPPVLRWISHETLERFVLRSTLLQRFVIDRHERAFRRLLPALGPIARITIVGGGLFPRTALILRRVVPDAALTIVDASAENLETARPFLGDSVRYVHEMHRPDMDIDADLVVIPLAYEGDLQRIYREPPASYVIVHDWVWSRRQTGTVVSWFLLKRLNLVRHQPN